jgi:1-acyl-sn-glycerol-3-phosphate acyltransferase
MIFIRSFIFNGVFYIGTAFAAILGAFGHIFGRKFTLKIACYWGHMVHFLLKWIVGLDYEIRGQEKWDGRPAIFACKHQSLLETAMIQVLAYDSGIILKRELLWIPIFGQAIQALGVIAIHRGKGKRAIDQLIEGALDSLEKGRNFMIYPEGTRKAVGAPVHLKHGIAALYNKARHPVIPIVLNTGHFWARRSFLRYPGKVIYQYLDPIEPCLSEEDFMKRLSNALEKGTQALDAETIAGKKGASKESSAFLGGLAMTLLGFLGYYAFVQQDKILDQTIHEMHGVLQNKGMTLSYKTYEKSLKGFAYEVRFIKPTLRMHSLEKTILTSPHGAWVLSKDLWPFNQDFTVHTTAPLHVLFQEEIGTLGAATLRWTPDRGSFHVVLENFKGPNVLLEKATIKAAKGESTNQISHMQLELTSLQLSFLPLPIDQILGDFKMPNPMVTGLHKENIQAWHDQGGVWDIGHFSILMSPLRLALKGTLSLDEHLQPLGAFTLEAQGLEKGLQAFEEKALLPSWMGAIMKLYLTGKGRPSERAEDQSPIYALGLSLQDNQIYLEGLPLSRVPEVKWSYGVKK